MPEQLNCCRYSKNRYSRIEIRFLGALVVLTPLSLPPRRRNCGHASCRPACLRCCRLHRRRGPRTCPPDTVARVALALTRASDATAAAVRPAATAPRRRHRARSGQRAVARPTAEQFTVPLAAVVDVDVVQPAGNVGAVGAGGRRMRRLIFPPPTSGRERSRRRGRHASTARRLHQQRCCATTASGRDAAMALRAPTRAHERAQMRGHRGKRMLITDGKRLDDA